MLELLAKVVNAAGDVVDSCSARAITYDDQQHMLLSFSRPITVDAGESLVIVPAIETLDVDVVDRDTPLYERHLWSSATDHDIEARFGHHFVYEKFPAAATAREFARAVTKGIKKPTPPDPHRFDHPT
jgi:hypothetical protein